MIPSETLNARLRKAGYLVVGLAAVFPVLDLLAALMPANFGNATWRFGAVGLLSNFAMGLSLEMFLLAVIAYTAGHRRVLLTLGIISSILVVVLLGSAVLFVLDTLQTRARIQPAMVKRFDFAAAGALAKLLLYAIANFLMARAGIAAGQQQAKGTGRARGMVAPVVAAPPVESAKR